MKKPKYRNEILKELIEHIILAGVICALLIGGFYHYICKQVETSIIINNAQDISRHYEDAIKYPNSPDNKEEEKILGILNGTGNGNYKPAYDNYTPIDSVTYSDTTITKVEFNDDSGHGFTQLVPHNDKIPNDKIPIHKISIKDDRNAYNRFLGKIGYMECLNSYDDEFVGIFNLDMKRIVSSNNICIFPVEYAKDNGDESCYYLYKTDNVRLIDILKECEQRTRRENYRYITDIESMYIKDSSFEPAVVYICKYKDNWDDYSTELIDREKVVFSDEPLDKGYKYINLKETPGIQEKPDTFNDRMLDIYYVHDDNAECDEMVQEIIDRVGSDIKDTPLITGSINKGLFKKTFYRVQMLDLNCEYMFNGMIFGEGDSVCNVPDSIYQYSDKFIVVNASQYDFMNDDIFTPLNVKNKIPVLILCFSVLILAVVLSFVAAGINYNKKKAKYNNEVYRNSVIESVAHDLKSPLTIIKGYVENFVDTEDPKVRESYADRIIKKITDMDVLIDKSILVGKTRDISSELDKKEVDVKELIEELVNGYNDLAGIRNVRFLIDGDLTLKTDRLWLGRALDNILSNAFTHGSGDVDITLTHEYIRVGNNYSKEMDVDVGKLTEPFVKGNKERSSTGNGLGLSIASNIINHLGYKLKLDAKDGRFTVDIIV